MDTISEDWFIPVSEYRRTTRLRVFPTYPLANTNQRCASVFDAPAAIWGFVPMCGHHDQGDSWVVTLCDRIGSFRGLPPRAVRGILNTSKGRRGAATKGNEPMTKRTYYTLLVRDDKTSPWAIHFGDYDLQCVYGERDDITEYEYTKGNTKIIKTADDQPAINAAVAALNA